MARMRNARDGLIVPQAAAATTLAETIRVALAEEIVAGRLAPGTEIDEQRAAERFGASRTPVREALRELAAAGLVTIEPRRGVRVAALTLEQLGEMFEVMAETEAMCARLATHRMTAPERFGLQALHERSATAVAADDVGGYDALNREFHSAMYRCTHNAFLAEHAQALRLRLATFRRAQLGGEDRLRRSFAEHAAVLHQVLRGDGEEAGRQMRAHMLAAGASLASTMLDQGHDRGTTSGATTGATLGATRAEPAPVACPPPRAGHFPPTPGRNPMLDRPHPALADPCLDHFALAKALSGFHFIGGSSSRAARQDLRRGQPGHRRSRWRGRGRRRADVDVAVAGGGPRTEAMGQDRRPASAARWCSRARPC